MGYSKLEELAYVTGEKFDVITKTRSIIGVSIPTVQIDVKPMSDYPYNLTETTVRFDEASMAMIDAVKILAELSGIEAALTKLAEAIASVKRRVNSLEYVIIPRMDNTIRFIRMYLEEREREDFFRLKRIKGRSI
jgi:V/A-type H+-transporting ATPase subunit D